MVAHAHRLSEQMLVAIADEMFELADVFRHRLRCGPRIASTTGVEDLLMRDDHVPAVAKRVAHAMMLAMRKQAHRAPEGLEYSVAARMRDDPVEDAVLGDEHRLVGVALLPHPLDRLGHFAKVRIGAPYGRFGGERGLDDLACLQDRD